MFGEWCVLHILTSKRALRHNGLHFFDISTSKSVPRMVCFVHFDFDMCFAPQRRAIFHLSSGRMAPHPPRRFSEPTVRPSGATNQWKNVVNRTCILFPLTLSILWSSFFFLLFSLFFSSLLFSDSSHLCFPIFPYCRKFDVETSFDKHVYVFMYFYLYVKIGKNTYTFTHTRMHVLEHEVHQDERSFQDGLLYVDANPVW